MKKVIKVFFTAVITLACFFFLSGCSIKDTANNKINNLVRDNISGSSTENENSIEPFEFLVSTYKEGESFLTSKEQIELKDVDGNAKRYSFNYNSEKYTATYTKDNWQIKNSYKIRNKNDITIICQALIDIHPIHGKDMKSYRTADDMMNEWVIHNIAYDYLPDNGSLKNHARDVDLNPADQGKTLKEMYEDRINK